MTVSTEGDIKLIDGSVTFQDTESRVVYQCHFMAWPDHDVPTHAYTLLKFRRTVLNYMSEDKGVLIHCR